MISFLRGKMIFWGPDFVLLEVGGIGFKIFLSSKNLEAIKKNSASQEIKIFTFLETSQKGIKLYGFLKEEELKIFEVVNEISGIGPKTALEISSFDFATIKKAIEQENIEFLERIPGIGKKKAKKIIFEISGKILKEKKETNQENEIVMALVNLGFPKNLAKEAVSKIPEQIQKTEEKIKEALKILGKKS